MYHNKLKIIPEVVHFIRANAVLNNISLSDEFILENNDEEHDITQNPIDRNKANMNGNVFKVFLIYTFYMIRLIILCLIT